MDNSIEREARSNSIYIHGIQNMFVPLLLKNCFIKSAAHSSVFPLLTTQQAS